MDTAIVMDDMSGFERLVVGAMEGRGRMDHTQIAAAAALDLDTVDRVLNRLRDAGVVHATEEDDDLVYSLAPPTTVGAGPARPVFGG